MLQNNHYPNLSIQEKINIVNLRINALNIELNNINEIINDPSKANNIDNLPEDLIINEFKNLYKILQNNLETLNNELFKLNSAII